MCRDLWNWQTKNPEGYSTPKVAAAPPVDNTSNDWVKVPAARDFPTTPEDAPVAPTPTPQPVQTPDKLNSSIVVSAPTIPTMREMHDPRTPAHLSPQHFAKAKDSAVPSPTGLDITSGDKQVAVNGSEKREITPADVFIDEKINQ